MLYLLDLLCREREVRKKGLHRAVHEKMLDHRLDPSSAGLWFFNVSDCSEREFGLLFNPSAWLTTGSWSSRSFATQVFHLLLFLQKQRLLDCGSAPVQHFFNPRLFSKLLCPFLQFQTNDFFSWRRDSWFLSSLQQIYVYEDCYHVSPLD